MLTSFSHLKRISEITCCAVCGAIIADVLPHLAHYQYVTNRKKIEKKWLEKNPTKCFDHSFGGNFWQVLASCKNIDVSTTSLQKRYRLHLRRFESVHYCFKNYRHLKGNRPRLWIDQLKGKNKFDRIFKCSVLWRHYPTGLTKTVHTGVQVGHWKRPDIH